MKGYSIEKFEVTQDFENDSSSNSEDIDSSPTSSDPDDAQTVDVEPTNSD